MKKAVVHAVILLLVLATAVFAVSCKGKKEEENE